MDPQDLFRTDRSIPLFDGFPYLVTRIAAEAPRSSLPVCGKLLPPEGSPSIRLRSAGAARP